jgi:NADPH-dependent 2,4-dienoyl-CoA reductase/sulfur reductase-like enzyme
MQEVFEGWRHAARTGWGLALRPAGGERLWSRLSVGGVLLQDLHVAARLLGGLYEPLIRRAAGLGSLSGKHDEGTYEKAFAFCDVLVIGAGLRG